MEKINLLKYLMELYQIIINSDDKETQVKVLSWLSWYQFHVMDEQEKNIDELIKFTVGPKEWKI